MKERSKTQQKWDTRFLVMSLALLLWVLLARFVAVMA